MFVTSGSSCLGACTRVLFLARVVDCAVFSISLLKLPSKFLHFRGVVVGIEIQKQAGKLDPVPRPSVLAREQSHDRGHTCWG